jgi:hypothetical protein
MHRCRRSSRSWIERVRAEGVLRPHRKPLRRETDAIDVRSFPLTHVLVGRLDTAKGWRLGVRPSHTNSTIWTPSRDTPASTLHRQCARRCLGPALELGG